MSWRESISHFVGFSVSHFKKEEEMNENYNTEPMIDCGICGRIHQNLPHVDCRAFEQCPKCGDAYAGSRHGGVLGSHIIGCVGEPSSNVVKEGENDMNNYVTRIGCLEQVCWCHVDPQRAGFECSSCGCVVVKEEI